MTIAQNFPAISPSLLLDFANVQALDPRISFTRATTATYYGTRTALAEQNLLLQSQTFDNASWSKVNSTVTADAIAAPDGTMTADTLQTTAATAAFLISQNLTLGVNTTSIYAQNGTANFFQLTYNGDTTSYANFDLSTGVVGTSAGTVTHSITSVGGGWYRIVVVNTSTAVTGIVWGIVGSASATRRQTFTAAGTETVFIWGAQLEQRSTVTAYQVTTTQPVTNYVPVLETAASGVARFDHNPVTFESLGLLIEEQRTNLVTYSEEFDNAAWIKSNATITANATAAPNGALTGDKLVESATTSIHAIFPANYSATSTTLTASIYAKAAERSSVFLEISNFATGSASCRFNLSAGTAGAASSNTGDYTNVSATISNAGNGWYRCTLTATKGTTNSNNFFVINLDNGTTNNYAGNGFSGLFIWGAQLEAGAFSTSYIPTVASQVTRAADAASMTGANFSSWYTQGEGTIYIEAAANSSTTTMTALTISDNTSSNRIVLGTGVNNTIWNPFIITGGVGQATLSQSASYPPQTSQKLAVAYKVNDFAATTSGINPTTDNSGILPVVDRVYIGAGATGVAVLNSTIKRFSFYPLRLTDTNLQAITG